MKTFVDRGTLTRSFTFRARLLAKSKVKSQQIALQRRNE